MPFRASHPVRFASCDAAGIAYYPKLFEICDGVIEDWTAEALGVPRKVLHLEQARALPTVDLRSSFERPARLGDTLDMTLAVRAVGSSSVDLELTADVDGARCFTVAYRQVLMDMRSARSMPWPEEWRVRLDAWVEEGDA